MDSGIYEIVNAVNGKRYIGSAVNLKNRKRQHLQSLARGDHHSVSLQRAWNKYGALFFSFSPLLICSKENLILYEQICMDAYKPEYNIAPKAGSQLGFKHSDESRSKMSQAAKRTKNFTGKRHSTESRAKISASRTGKGGGPMSEERRIKIGAAHKGRVITDEQRAKISATLTGHKQSAEQIEKRMQKIRGRKMPNGFSEAASARMKGIKFTESHCVNIGRSKAKLTDEQVREIRLRLKSGDSQISIAKLFAIDPSTISDIKNGKSYVWVLE